MRFALCNVIMAKVKLTKGELKVQRDSLRQYERFLPTLQLKKQQLQMEILGRLTLLEKKIQEDAIKRKSFLSWSGLFSDSDIDIKKLIKIKKIVSISKNIAGVDIPVFERCEFHREEYDLFTTPVWIDHALDALCVLIGLRSEIKIIEESVNILKQELRVTTQRVNLFEKVKIPQAQEAIRVIKIYIGDQMTNAVGRSKIAKRKIEYANA